MSKRTIEKCVALLMVGALGMATAAERRLPMDEFRDKMEGAWVGQSVGVAYGYPTEFKYKAELVPDKEMPTWRPEMVNNTFEQDDLYVEMSFISTLERRGLGVTCREAGIDFANSRYRLWCANANARDNLRHGIAAPASSHPTFHPSPDDIDYQIEADFSGILAPGLPQAAVDLGETFGRIMNYGDGLYAGQFTGALYAEAYFETDCVKLVETALKAIPKESKYAQMVRDMLAWHKADAKDWKKAWELAVDKYGRAGCAMTGKATWWGIDVKINGAMVLLGLLWGEGDMERTMRISTQGGYDSDCNPSSACGVLGTMIGMKRLGAKYTSALSRTNKWEYTTYDWPKLMKVCEGLVKEIVVKYGGKVEKDAAGVETLVIRAGEVRPSRFFDSLKPGPVPEDVRLTDAEQKRVLYRPCKTQGGPSESKQPSEPPLWPTVLPLADGGEEAVARDARWLVTNTIVDSVAWCCTLVPEGGDTPVDKASVYAERYRRIQPFLKGSGVRQGILFQATVGHGWTPGAPTGWQKIVARNGSSLYKFCPLGAEFKRYIAGQARTLAALGPDFFMVDDDTRYLTGVDGCFCPVHLAGFAARQGRADRPWTREQLAADLAKDGRLAEDWDRYLEDTMVPLMETIRAAFPKDIPGQFCCCAGDSHHAARMAAALAAPGQEPVVRINNALYLNDSLRDAFLRRWGQTAWQINDLPGGTVVLDEADPCPHTRYSMDATRLVHHIALNALQGCRGAKIWLTRLGNVHEVESGRAYRELFHEKHGWMREIARLRLARTGVVIPQPNVRSRTTPVWRVFDWGTAIFGRMGIPYRYGNPVARHEVVALNEDIVGHLTDGELEWYLGGACLLDGSAAEALTKRGFAKMIGVKAKRREGTSVSAERYERETLWNGVGVAADLSDADAKAVPMSRYLNRRSGLSSETTDLGAGSLWFESAAGGRIAIVASHLVDGQNLMRTDYYNETRKRELARILTKLGGGAMPGGAFYAGDAEILAVTGRAADGRRILVLDNLGLDDVRRPPLKFGVPVKGLRRLTDGGAWEPVAAGSADGLVRPDVTLRTYRPEVFELR